MQQKLPFDIGAAVAAAKSILVIPDPAPGQPALVMLCGLPGTGKSTLARQLAHRLPAVVVESDQVRHRLFAPPVYDAEESQRVHQVCHILMGWHLRRYYHVVYDATNLYERHRVLAYRLAARHGAQLVVAEVTASDDVVRERLAPRKCEAYSQADWQVYLRMRRGTEPIQHQHITLDTSDSDIDRGVRSVLEAVRGQFSAARD
jgi:predicted kinase